MMRPLWYIRTIAEPWDEGDGFECTKVDVDGWPSLAVGSSSPGAMQRWWPSSKVAITLPEFGDRHMPGDRRSLIPG